MQLGWGWVGKSVKVIKWYGQEVCMWLVWEGWLGLNVINGTKVLE